jgi:phospholipase A1
MKFLLLLMLFVYVLQATTQEYKETYLLYEAGEYKKALLKFKKLAVDENDYDAANMLAKMYEKGKGCEVDKDKAAYWYKVSSDGFHKRSQYSVDDNIEKNTDDLFNTLNNVEDRETRKTLYQYAHSIFNIKAHYANYLLPISLRLNGDYDDPTKHRDTSKAEVEFQISVKYDFMPNLLGLGELYSVAYTQHSFWQYFVGDAYFRSSDYNPEIYITVPLNTEYMKAIRVAFAHTSNGLGLPQERAWNYITLSSYFQFRSIFTELQLWTRLPDNYDYNPDLIDTMGHGHIKFMIPYKKHLLTTLLRNNFKGKGAVDIGYSYPLFSESLFLYVKGFAGYGESMSSYGGNPENTGMTSLRDDNVKKIAIGFSLSR